MVRSASTGGFFAMLLNHEGAFHGLCGPWGALIRLHGMPNWFWRQIWSTIWVMPVWVTYWWHITAISVWMFALGLRLPTLPHCPSHPPPIDSIHIITDVRKTTSKTWGIQIACRISYEIIISYITRLLMLCLTWLHCTIREPQPIQYLKSVFLEILNVTTWSVFQNQITHLLNIIESTYII